MSHGIDDAFAECDETQGDAETAVKEKPHRRRSFRADHTFLEDHPDGDKRTDGVGNVVASVRESAETRRQNLQVLEHLRNGRSVLTKVWKGSKRSYIFKPKKCAYPGRSTEEQLNRAASFASFFAATKCRKIKIGTYMYTSLKIMYK